MFGGFQKRTQRCLREVVRPCEMLQRFVDERRNDLMAPPPASLLCGLGILDMGVDQRVLYLG